jgi:hypothetical protein
MPAAFVTPRVSALATLHAWHAGAHFSKPGDFSHDKDCLCIHTACYRAGLLISGHSSAGWGAPHIRFGGRQRQQQLHQRRRAALSDALGE